ncbi:MAG TPA: hypothetical protein VFZ15_00545 [Acidimicrobiia bacterium]|nr:hypothetical protein [Acidimicrobiia bacterium]
MSSTRSAPRRRRLATGLLGWVFGLASTVLLVGLWGRAVVVDTDELTESLSPMAGSDLVADRFSTWLESELLATGVDGPTASVAADEVLEHPAVGPLLEDLVAEGIEAAASADPSGSSVDVASILQPSAGVIAAGMNDAGVPVSAAQVETALAELDPLVIRGPSDRPLVGSSSPLATTLGTAALLGVAFMLMSGWAYVLASRDRARAVRNLLSRFALGALSFAVLLKIGAWIVDPEGGRAPVGESLALVADSKWMVPTALGLASLAGFGVAWLFRRKIRPEAGSRSMPERPIRQEA